MIPNALKEWYADPSNMSELERALSDPALKKAMDVLRSIALPKTDFSNRGSAESITHAAFEQCRNSGFFSYPDELWGLTEPLAKPPVPPQGYSDSYAIEWAKKHGMWEDFDKEQQP